MENISILFDYEKEALLEALRRDIRHSERQAKIADNVADAEYHAFNSRFVTRLLEILSPKSYESESVDTGLVMSSR
jgi:hypothetical protein